MATHPDGSECLEGIKSKIPDGVIPCCSSFEHRLNKCVYDLRIQWYSKNWGIALQDGSYIAIRHCPFCGKLL